MAMLQNEFPDFDFEADTLCQTVFKPFIVAQLQALAAYDARRRPGSAYIFHEHAARVADDVAGTCLFLGLGPRAAGNMRWATLPHDMGKMQLPPEIWDQDEKPDEALKARRRAHTILGADAARQALTAHTGHPFFKLMEDIMRHHHEQMDGRGYLGIKGAALSLPVRLASIVEAFDGWRVARPHFGARDVTVEGVLKRMETEKAAQFDPKLLAAFATYKRGQG